MAIFVISFVLIVAAVISVVEFGKLCRAAVRHRKLKVLSEEDAVENSRPLSCARRL
jgi:hypothetical protein